MYPQTPSHQRQCTFTSAIDAGDVPHGWNQGVDSFFNDINSILIPDLQSDALISIHSNKEQPSSFYSLLSHEQDFGWTAVDEYQCTSIAATTKSADLLRRWDQEECSNLTTILTDEHALLSCLTFSTSIPVSFDQSLDDSSTISTSGDCASWQDPWNPLSCGDFDTELDQLSQAPRRASTWPVAKSEVTSSPKAPKRRIDQLKAPRLAARNSEAATFVCQLCAQKFRWAKDLKRHMASTKHCSKSYEWYCPYDGCPRSADPPSNARDRGGFNRKDKYVAHCQVHQSSINRHRSSGRIKEIDA